MQVRVHQSESQSFLVSLTCWPLPAQYLGRVGHGPLGSGWEVDDHDSTRRLGVTSCSMAFSTSLVLQFFIIFVCMFHGCRML